LWCHVGTYLEQDAELAGIARLVLRQMKIERVAVAVAFEVDFRAESAAGTPKGLILLPPFAPAADTWARIEVLSKSWISPAVRLQAAKAWKKLSNVPDFDRRENRFQTLFQLPNSAGRARQVMLCTVK
jgi:hypothetical protein